MDNVLHAGSPWRHDDIPHQPDARRSTFPGAPRASVKPIGAWEPGQAWHWLNRLAQKTPLEVIKTDSGFHSVLGVLGRIEHRV